MHEEKFAMSSLDDQSWPTQLVLYLVVKSMSRQLFKLNRQILTLQIGTNLDIYVYQIL
jgi:hypothetical protein